MAYLDLAGRALLGFVMALAVVGKLSSSANWRQFRQSLNSFSWVPRRFRPAIAVAVVVAEAAVALLLVPPSTERAGAALGALLLTVVSAALVAARVGGRDVRCACFGADDRPVGAWHLLRNTALVLVAVAVAVDYQPSVQAVPGAVAGLVVGVGAVCAVVLTHPGELAFLIVPARSDVRRSG
jgi:methylamine utilization protein MauE